MSYFGSFKLSDDSISQAPSGALRVAQLTTLHDGKILNSDEPELYSIAGTGTGAFALNKYNMSVSGGQYLVRQTSHYFVYSAGKPQVVEHTFDNFQTEAGVVKRIGYFSSNAVAPFDTTKDGFWLEDDGITKRMIVSRAGVETFNIPITAWDNYALISGYNWANFTVFFWDFLWLGGAVLRLWVKTDQGFVLAHSIKHAGNFTDVMMLSPNQPVRYEIRSSTGTGSLRYICSQVASEGSISESGKSISVHNLPASPVAVSAIGSNYVLCAVRKLATHRDTPIKVNSIGCINLGTADNGFLSLYKNPTMTGGTLTYVNSTDGKFQFSRNTNSALLVTAGSGRALVTVPVSASGIGYPLDLDFLSFLGSSIADVMDEYVLVYSPVTATQSVVGIINLKQY
jgi:hypothetical protein